jgi:hypothetical protein
MKKLLLISLALVGCTNQSDMIQDTNLFTSVDPQIQPYFDQFTQLAGVPTTGITAGFSSLGGRIAGECVANGPYREVRIDTNSWNTYGWTTYQKQQLISHELGHCALGLQHINNCRDGTTAPDGTESSCNNGTNMPLSIMNWQMFDINQAPLITQQYYQYLKLNQPIP